LTVKNLDVTASRSSGRARGVASPVLGGGAARPHPTTVAWLQHWKVTDLTGTKE